jgi:hypothetical protein
MTICSNCGAQFSGNYCPNCGTAARPGQEGITQTFWKGSDIEQTIGFISALLRIASGPVQNTLQLAASTSFGQKGFLIKCIAISAAIGIYSKVHFTNDILAAILSTGGMFVMVFIQVLITYAAFRLFSSTQRSGGDYARLICIAQGVAFLFMGCGEFLGLTFGIEVYAMAMVVQAVILIPYWALVLGRFWNMNAALAYLIFIFSMLPAAIVAALILMPMMMENDFIL